MIDFSQLRSHMPFLMRDQLGNRVLFFCLAQEDNIWKIHVSVNDGTPLRIETGFSLETIECSPSAWHDESGWHVTFIAGGAVDDPVYRLYRMDGPTLEMLSQPIAIRPTRAGFVYQDRLVTADLHDRFTIHDHERDRTVEMFGVYLYRVSYRSDDPDKLLISGAWINEIDALFTVEYDVKTGEQFLIECDGKSAYKCTVFEGEVLDTIQTGEHFELRQIRKAGQFKKSPCRMMHQQPDDDMVVPGIRACRCKKSVSQSVETISRPSCLECVEKHIGAAMVILSEIHAGYAYHLRFVGHLHEAEEESQQWPKLFELIRHARKEYQTKNRLPDWENLVQEIAAVKGDMNHASG